ncbi:hypothetical protein HBI45_055450 [Parastagonospora nodorum]|nr:hypothetical protein HBI45_055450 [Parastagonospora nodorum]
MTDKEETRCTPPPPKFIIGGYAKHQTLLLLRRQLSAAWVSDAIRPGTGEGVAVQRSIYRRFEPHHSLKRTYRRSVWRCWLFILIEQIRRGAPIFPLKFSRRMAVAK